MIFQMRDFSDMALVREYARRNSEEAFAELVSQRAKMVLKYFLSPFWSVPGHTCRYDDNIQHGNNAGQRR
jgi:hypothetical protein